MGSRSNLPTNAARRWLGVGIVVLSVLSQGCTPEAGSPALQVGSSEVAGTSPTPTGVTAPGEGSSGTQGQPGGTLDPATLSPSGGAAGAVGFPSTAGSGAAAASDPGADGTSASGSGSDSGGLRCTADEATPQRTDYSQRGPHMVGVMELMLNDASRPIEANEHHAAAASRQLFTRIYYPAKAMGNVFQAAALADGGPFPLLMYSHGYSSNVDEAKVAGEHAASHGYIVVAANFPLSSLFANDGSPDVTDIPNQPRDVSFLIDRVLEFSEQSGHLLQGAVDAERIGALGVSAGGLTTLLVSLHATDHDPRIRAAMPVAPLASFLTPAFYEETRSIPLLFVHGTLDAFIDYETNGRRAFERSLPNSYLITVDKGSHAAFALPLDEGGLEFVSDLLVPPEWNKDNPDAMGCAAVGANLTEAGNFLAELTGPDHHYERDELELPCQGDEMTMESMTVNAQRKIYAESAVAFFDAQFAATAEERHDGCRYLLYEMPKRHAVTVE